MNETIWKHPLPDPGVERTLYLVEGAEVVHFGIQHGLFYLWEKHAVRTAETARAFAIVGTGWSSLPGKHLGVVQDGSFVWHLIEFV